MGWSTGDLSEKQIKPHHTRLVDWSMERRMVEFAMTGSGQNALVEFAMTGSGQNALE
jgi:hypothetical protein